MTSAEFWGFSDELVTPEWRARRRLATAARQLIERVVEADASEAALDAATAMVERANLELAAAKPRELRATLASGTPVARAVFADASTLVGLSNPLAPPMVVSHEGALAVGEVTFGLVFQGAPGWVHGGFVAAAFDQVFGHLQSRRGLASVTGTLTVRYRRPTPLQRPLRFEAEADKSIGRRHHLRARALADGELTAEAEAMFIELDPARIGEVTGTRSGETDADRLYPTRARPPRAAARLLHRTHH